MKKTVFIIVFLFSCLLILSGQSMDELPKWKGQLAELPVSSIDERLALLDKIGKISFRISPDTAKAFLLEGIALAEKHNKDTARIEFNMMLTQYYSQIGAMEELAIQAQKVLDLGKSTGINVGYYHGYADLGYYYEIVGNYEKALDLQLKALEHAKGENPFLQGRTYIKIVDIFIYLRNYDKALQYIEEAKIAFAKKENNTYGDAILLVRKGDILFEMKKYKEAIPVFKEAIFLSRKMSFNNNIALCLNNLSGVFLMLNQPDSVIYYSTQAMQVSISSGVEQSQITSASRLGVAYLQKNDLDKAKYYATIALDKAKKFNQLQELSDPLETLEKIELRKGEYKKAYAYVKELEILKDSFFNVEAQRTVEEIEARFQNEKKQQQIELQNEQLKQQRLLIGGAILLTLLSLIFGWYAWRTSQQRRKTNRLLTLQKTQLESLDRTKSRFFTNISHELRTPLQLILAPLEIALRKNKNKALTEDLELAQRNSKKLLTLVNEILDLSKLESSNLILRESSVNLENFLRRILYSYHSLAQIRAFTLKLDYKLESDLWIEMDKGKVEKIITNLLSNAFKYSMPKGTITLMALAKLDQLHILVRDEGKGIASGELEKIFDRFYQTEGEEEPLQGGTGIGLALAKELAGFMKGDLRVESQLEEGSTFILTLPLKRTEVLAMENQISDLPEKVLVEMDEKSEVKTYTPVLLNGQKAKILLVEDNPEMSQFLRRLLSANYQCILAMDGEQALTLAQNQAFDLIISDVMMPRMDGFTFLKKIKEKGINRQTPFILLTARAFSEDKLYGLRLGVDDYITKPFQTNELEARIINLLENKKQRDAWSTEQKTTASKEVEESLNYEEELLKKIEEQIIKNISNTSYKIEQLCADINYSRRQTERLIKKMTGLTPLALIREIRLLKAEQYLLKKQFPTIAEVAYNVGFDDPGYFTKLFVKRFGKKPSEVILR